ncbi:MAG: Gfo/Idh/MocA family oxidoreductase [Armatimonadetes bacterium]|nr:Gfo/Idh/MocA family oxidoreductase [Armatimonadota bacterium]
MAEKVRIGIVGVGSRGIGLLSILLQFPNTEIRAICDVNDFAVRNALDIIERKAGIRADAHKDWRNLCDRDDLDAVVIATQWEWHAQIAIGAMKAGKYVGVEVPACMTIEECHELIKISEQTSMPCMMLENVNYLRSVLAITRMVREGIFGELIYAEAGYQHDCRSLAFTEDGHLTWRGHFFAEKNGNQYPTHAIGPIAWWLNINRGDRFVRLRSVSSKSRGLREYARAKFGPDHPLANREYAQGDINTTILETANGVTVTLYFDVCSPRPYDPIFRLQGTKGICEGSAERIHIEGMSPKDQWEPLSSYLEKYDHPLWKSMESEALRNAGHGGCDYVVMHEFVKAVRNRTQTPQDVYDAVTWSAIIPLSFESVKNGGTPVEFPDFTSGRWKTTLPLSV